MVKMVNEDIMILKDKEIFDSLKDHFLISIWDAEGNITYANPNFYNVFKSESNPGRINATELIKSMASSHRDYWEICQTLLAGFKWQGILYHKDENDKTYCMETSISPVKNEMGLVERYIAIGNDISTVYCNSVATSLAYNDEKRLLENITKHPLFITKQGKIFNSSRSDRTSPFLELLGSNIYDYINPVNHSYLRDQIHRVFTEGKTCKYQSLGLSSKMNQVFFVTKIRPVLNLQGDVIYATVKSKKHKTGLKANKQLKSIETKYTNIFHSINVGIIVVANANGIIIEWNKGAERAFGYSDVEIVGKHLSAIVSQKHLDKGIQELLKVKDKLDKNLDSSNVQMIGLKKNGDEFPVEFALSNWQNGKEKFYCAVMIDMTNHKKLESKLKKTTEDLELFLYRAAHDLKAPLTSAEGLLQLLKDEEIPETSRELVNMLDETLEKGRMLLDDLALASIISEKSREVTPIKFRKKMANAIKALKGMENFGHINFHFDIQQESSFLFNRELMEFILQTFMRNVLDFSKPKTNEHAPQAWISIHVTTNVVHIKISDNGLGISKMYLHKIFDLYFSACKNESRSTGLELYIVKRIVEEFHGEIKVESELNQGTSFEVILPNIKEGDLSYD